MQVHLSRGNNFFCRADLCARMHCKAGKRQTESHMGLLPDVGVLSQWTIACSAAGCRPRWLAGSPAPASHSHQLSHTAPLALCGCYASPGSVIHIGMLLVRQPSLSCPCQMCADLWHKQAADICRCKTALLLLTLASVKKLRQCRETKETASFV